MPGETTPSPRPGRSTIDPYRPGCPLEEVLITEKLRTRVARTIPAKDQQIAVDALTRAMGSTPDKVMDTLADHALRLCDAQSAGISVEDLSVTPAVFRWHAVAGKMSPSRGGTMPRDFSPCTETTARGSPLLMRQPVRHYPYVESLGVKLEEVLLVPFLSAVAPWARFGRSLMTPRGSSPRAKRGCSNA